jgi:hypothetical protein
VWKSPERSTTTYTSLTKDIETAPLAFILGWCADYPDPQNWLRVLRPALASGLLPNPDLRLTEAADMSDPAADSPTGPGFADRGCTGGNGLEQRQHLPGQAVGHGMARRRRTSLGVQVLLSITIDQSMMP